MTEQRSSLLTCRYAKISTSNHTAVLLLEWSECCSVTRVALTLSSFWRAVFPSFRIIFN